MAAQYDRSGPPAPGAPWWDRVVPAVPSAPAPPPVPPPSPPVAFAPAVFAGGPPIPGAPWFAGTPPVVLAPVPHTGGSSPPSPPPPAPPSHNRPFVPRVPDVEARLRRFTETVQQVLDGLMRTGQLHQTSAGTWVVENAGGSGSGLTGRFTDTFP